MSDMNRVNIEIPAQLGETVNESLRQVTAIHRRRVVKRACATFGSFAAVLAAFLALGFTHPALAAQIPLIGGLFQNVSQKNGQVAANLEGYGVVQSVGKTAATDNSQWEMTASEAYSDGGIAQVGLELSAPAEVLARYSFVGAKLTDKKLTCEATVNGEPAILHTVSAFTPQGDKLTGAARLDIPESQKGAGPFQIALILRDLEGHVKSEISGNEVTVENIPGEFRLEFPLAVDGEHKTAFSCEAEDNGAKVLAVTATPAQIAITVEKPYWGEVNDWEVTDEPDSYPKGFPYLYTLDGHRLSIDSNRTYVQRDGNGDMGNYDPKCRETQRADLYFDGLPAGETQAVLRFIEGDSSERAIAEFTIDFEKGTVEPGSSLDDDSPCFYQILQGGPMQPDGFDGYMVTNVNFSRYDGDRVGAYIETPSETGGEHLRFTLTDSQGNTWIDTSSILEDGSWNEDALWKFSPPITSNDPDSGRVVQYQGSYGLSLAAESMPPKDTAVTATVTDLDTGKVLCEDRFVLDCATTR